MQDSIQQAVEVIQNAKAIWIGSGAGMGVDSGLPDFRGDEGFWKAYPPYRNLGLSFVDLANPAWFQDDPERAWGFYGHRRNLYRQVQPHEGFKTLLDWVTKINSNYFVFTSNVDGHFQKARFDEKRIVECHGSIDFLQCSKRCCNKIWEAESTEIEIDESTMRTTGQLPKCIECGEIARPNILMFGDGRWLSNRTDQQYVRYQNWLELNDDPEIVGLEFGAGTAVPTIRWEAESLTDKLIRINPRETHVPIGSISIKCGALEAINLISDLLP